MLRDGEILCSIIGGGVGKTNSSETEKDEGCGDDGEVKVWRGYCSWLRRQTTGC